MVNVATWCRNDWDEEMNEPVWGEVQRPGAIGGFVLPLMVGVLRRVADEFQLHAETVEGTGFLVAGGRGLGITARHVAKALLAAAPIPDPWTPVSEITDGLRVPGTGFISEEGDFHNQPIGAIELHPTEDVALFRLPDGDYYSPYTINADKREDDPAVVSVPSLKLLTASPSIWSGHPHNWQSAQSGSSVAARTSAPTRGLYRRGRRPHDSPALDMDP
jgi:hypothetical protein